MFKQRDSQLVLPVRKADSGISFAIREQPWTSWPETFDCVTAGSSARQQLDHHAAAAAGGSGGRGGG